MRIIEEGLAPVDCKFEATCRACGTKFEFQESEVRTVFDQRDGDYFTMTCPLPRCGATVTVQKDYRR